MSVCFHNDSNKKNNYVLFSSIVNWNKFFGPHHTLAQIVMAYYDHNEVIFCFKKSIFLSIWISMYLYKTFPSILQ